MTKKVLMLAVLAVSSVSLAFAGGILTNTNQSARFGRLFALEAMTNAADGAYYNPAGTVKLKEGFHFTFTNQSAFQERIINTSFAPMGAEPKQYVGKASAAIIPSLQGVYRKGKWALSGGFAVVGGGGKATFENGLPSFESVMASVPVLVGGLSPNIPGTETSLLTMNKYSMDSYMTGINYVFGGQLGGAYKINDMFSVYAGFRLNIVSNKYEGYVRDVKINPNSPMSAQYPVLGNGDMVSAPEYFQKLATSPLLDQLGKPELKQTLGALAVATADKELESKQSGWGVAPILGVNFSWNKLNIGARYEFKTALDIENKTHINKDAGIDAFKDGVNTAHDIPALFAIGASYDIIDPVTISVSYHHFFDKDAGMSNNKQVHLTGGTNEYLFGAEWRINKMFLISGGGQVTKYGLADDFQSDLSFSVDSYSLGFGGAVNVSKNWQINAAYFFTQYSDYTKNSASYVPALEAVGAPKMAGTDVFTRKNKVFTVGVDFSF